MYTSEKYVEMNKLCSIYKTKLDNWQNKRTSAVIEFVEEGISRYNHKTGKLILSSANPSVIYHEMGHEMWHNSSKKFSSLGHTELFRRFWNEGIQSTQDALVWIEILKEEYYIKASYSLIPVTDVLGMWLDEKIPGYYCHSQGYTNKFTDEEDIYSNEFFANICGLIGTYDIRGLMLVSDIFPKTFSKVLDIIDEMMSKAIH